jgi:hypothetical protein
MRGTCASPHMWGTYVPFSAFSSTVETKIAPVVAYSIKLTKFISSSNFSRKTKCAGGLFIHRTIRTPLKQLGPSASTSQQSLGTCPQPLHLRTLLPLLQHGPQACNLTIQLEQALGTCASPAACPATRPPTNQPTSTPKRPAPTNTQKGRSPSDSPLILSTIQSAAPIVDGARAATNLTTEISSS